MIWTFASSQLFQVFVGFGITLPCLLGSHLLLNLRDVHRKNTPQTVMMRTRLGTAGVEGSDGENEDAAGDWDMMGYDMTRWDHLFNMSMSEEEPEVGEEQGSDASHRDGGTAEGIDAGLPSSMNAPFDLNLNLDLNLDFDLDMPSSSDITSGSGISDIPIFNYTDHRT